MHHVVDELALSVRLPLLPILSVPNCRAGAVGGFGGDGLGGGSGAAVTVPGEGVNSGGGNGGRGGGGDD